MKQRSTSLKPAGSSEVDHTYLTNWIVLVSGKWPWISSSDAKSISASREHGHYLLADLLLQTAEEAMTPIESTFSIDVNAKLDWYVMHSANFLRIEILNKCTMVIESGVISGLCPSRTQKMIPQRLKGAQVWSLRHYFLCTDGSKFNFICRSGRQWVKFLLGVTVGSLCTTGTRGISLVYCWWVSLLQNYLTEISGTWLRSTMFVSGDW